MHPVRSLMLQNQPGIDDPRSPRRAWHEVTPPVRTVLVVDDNAGNRALAEATLQDDGYHVIFAEDGESAITAFERNQPQCILLDIQMPGIGGLAACRTIRALPGGSRAAILFVTAQHDVETFDLALAAGGDDFVTKPYRPRELGARMQTAIRLRRDAHERDDLCELIKRQRDDLQRVQLQICDANEKLVLATLTADRLVEEANAARAAAALEEERFRTLVVTSSALQWRASAEGHVRVDRASMQALTGVEIGTGGSDWLDVVHPQDRERAGRTWQEAVAAAAPYECQYRVRTTDGTFAWMLARAAPIPAGGPVREWIGTLTDVTASIRIEEARDRFIGVLGHDLRTPLGAILMGVGLLDEVSETQTSIVERITRSAHRMVAMIDDVLDFARGRLGGGIPLAVTTADLGELCDEAVAEMKLANPGRLVTFEAAGDLRGNWDPARVAQVLSNLLGNAIKHGVGAIHVTSRTDGADVVTTVHNEGPAIPAALLPILFEPFTGQAPGMPGVRDGLGLGLYIASEIVRAHEGSISMTSTEDQGTTVSVRWPRSSAVASHQAGYIEPKTTM